VTEVALSTGCLAGHEERLHLLDGRAVELSSHRPKLLDRVLAAVRRSAARVMGVHAPCPTPGHALNLAAEGRRWARTAQELMRTMELARQVGAGYVVVHAFYALAEALPSDDVRRAISLRSLVGDLDSIEQYLDSDAYDTARQRAARNLKALAPELRRSFPRQQVVLENLNPRLGYGGILVDDVLEVARELDGDVGICLDLGHLTLAGAALGLDLGQQVARARDLVRVTHVHQNFGGRHLIDRWWNDSRPRPGLQEVDAHLPLLTRYTPASRRIAVTAENSAFEGILLGSATYSHRADDPPARGAVPVERLLSLVDRQVPRVLEYDSRYAPLQEIVHEHDLARAGRHPVGLR
jgi:sugar phosphate isomerase/epimerase